MADSALWHFSKNLFLLYLSLAFLPFSTTVIVLISIWRRLFSLDKHNTSSVLGQKTILVTGVCMSKGLAIARLLHSRGHRVIGADSSFLSIGRVSKVINKFYSLPNPGTCGGEGRDQQDPYVLRLLDMVRSENIDLWISVSDVNAAIQDAVAKDLIESHTSAKAIQLSQIDVGMLHGKETFIEYIQSLGLRTPISQAITSKTAIVDFLNQRGGLHLQPGGTRFLLKPTGVNDLVRFDMPLLPLPSKQETLSRIGAIPIGDKSTFIAQEFIQGQEFCTHALVIRGCVRAFVACPSSELLMHYTALPAESPLSLKMLAFTKAVADANGKRWTGHVSFDFLVKDGQYFNDYENDVQIYPIECNPRVHTAIVLFGNTPELADEFLTALEPDCPARQEPLSPQQPYEYYWIGHDLIDYVAYPTYQTLMLGTLSYGQLWRSVQLFTRRMWNWKDGTFEAWDPWPWWWLIHVYWPVKFGQYLIKGRWHKVNVSTGKEFQAN